MRKTLVLVGLIALAAHLSACGDGGNDDNITISVCGDGLVEGNEDCDETNLNGKTCTDLGFTSGTLDCTSGCHFDTSSCSGGGPTSQMTPTTGPTPMNDETATPAANETATATEAPGITPTPAATVTPSGRGATCQQGDTVTIKVAIAYDAVSFPDVSGITTTLAHPEELDVPGNQSTTDQSRGANLTGKSGFFNISDQDQSGNGTDDHIVIGLIATPNVVPPGDLATVTFDCAAGATVPTAASFPCAADLSTNSGTTVTGASCSVTSATGP